MKFDEKWAPVFEDEALVMKLLPLQPEEVQKALAEAGYDFTLDETIEMGKQLNALKDKMSAGEISDNDLEDVAGGLTVPRSPIPNLIKAASKALSW